MEFSDPDLKRKLDQVEIEIKNAEASRGSSNVQAKSILVPSDSEECTEIKNKARSRVYFDQWKLVHENRILFNIKPAEYNQSPEMQEMFAEWRKLKDRTPKETKHHPLFWVTVNPVEDNLPELMRKTAKMVSHSFVDKYYMVFEQRASPGENYKGYHCHALIQRHDYATDRSDKYFCDHMRNSVRGIIGNDNACKITPTNMSEKRKIITYMQGTKSDASKTPAVNHTRDWRLIFKIEDMYSNDPDYFETLNLQSIPQETEN